MEIEMLNTVKTWKNVPFRYLVALTLESDEVGKMLYKVTNMLNNREAENTVNIEKNAKLEWQIIFGLRDSLL